MVVCGEAGSSDDAFHQIEELSPDVAIIDISLEDAHGLDLVQNLRAQFPAVETVVFSKYDEEAYAERAIRAGASGYVMKNKSPGSVVDAIRRVRDGELYLSAHISTNILNKVADRSTDQPDPSIDALTDRELAVFQMLGQGYGIETIKDRLNLARKTVETYRRRAMKKLGFDSMSELLQYAVEWTHTQSTEQEPSVTTGPSSNS